MDTESQSGRGHETETGSKPFQVLSVDGGGLKGIFAAAALANLEADFDTRLINHFDLIAGTSTGGIIALGLASGLSATEILDFYLANQARIFPSSRTRGIRRLFKPYSVEPLAMALEEVFGDKTLADCPVRLTIPSFSLTANDVYVFRTPHLSKLRRDHRVRLTDVALATSAAPTFFPAHNLDDLRLVDGGVWANNPSMVGLTEASTCSGGNLGSVSLLNVGTTSELTSLSTKLDSAGVLRWAPQITGTVMRGQAQQAYNHARLQLGADRAHRLDIKVPRGAHQLDRVEAGDLMGHASAATRNASPALAPLFDHQAAPYTYGSTDNS